MRSHDAQLTGRRALTPHLLRLTVAGDGLRAWNSTHVGDEYVRVTFAPTDIGSGTTSSSATRVYTVAGVHEDGALDLDVVLHDTGLGSAWAETAPIGARVGISDPDSMYRAAPETRDLGFVCDLTGVPALARILRGLESRHRVSAAVVVTDLADVVDLPTPASLDVVWVLAEDLRTVPDRLESLAREVAPTAGYVWATGEARACRGIRRYLRGQLGRSNDAFLTCGYWQLDAERIAARYAEVAERIAAESARARSEHTDRGAYLDALDAIYDRAGL